MKANLASLAIGALFGLGLAVSGMINPAKVLNFLDFAGTWDPTLALVMAAALAVSLPGFALVRRRGGSLWGGPLRLPERAEIDRPLIGGALLFGVGWGLVGLCPGPALAALGSGSGAVLLFVVAMLAGMAAHHWLFER